MLDGRALDAFAPTEFPRSQPPLLPSRIAQQLSQAAFKLLVQLVAATPLQHRALYRHSLSHIPTCRKLVRIRWLASGVPCPGARR